MSLPARFLEAIRRVFGRPLPDFARSLDTALARDEGVTLRLSALERAVAARTDASHTHSLSQCSQED